MANGGRGRKSEARVFVERMVAEGQDRETTDQAGASCLRPKRPRQRELERGETEIDRKRGREREREWERENERDREREGGQERLTESGQALEEGPERGRRCATSSRR